MLVIRNAQLHAISDALLARWIGECLREWHPPEMTSLSAESAGELAKQSIERGRALGLRYDEDILRFARVTLLLGSRFDLNPQMEWTREYLEDWDPDVGERVAQLEKEALRRMKGGAAL